MDEDLRKDLVELFEDLLEHAEFYYSAVELDVYKDHDGEELERKLLGLLERLRRK